MNQLLNFSRVALQVIVPADSASRLGQKLSSPIRVEHDRKQSMHEFPDTRMTDRIV